MTPRNAGPVSNMHELTVEERKAQPNGCQARWYRWVAARVQGQSVLDAGAGTGYGIEILREAGCVCEGFDLLPAGPLVQPGRIEDYPSGSWDWVVSLDVIEHVEDDVGFLAQLLRVARVGVFFSTPNWNQWGAGNAFHVREYSPLELVQLLAGLDAEVWSMNIGDHRPPLRLAPLSADESAANFGVVIHREIDPLHHYLHLARVAIGTGPLGEQLPRLVVWVGTYLRGCPEHTGELRPLEILIGGIGWCDQMVRVLLWLARRLLGLPGRMVAMHHSDGVHGHTAAEVWYSGSWHFIDPHPHYMQVYWLDGTIASHEALRARPAVVGSNACSWRGDDGVGLPGYFVTPPQLYTMTSSEPPEFVEAAL